jgi:hypothetical protein
MTRMVGDDALLTEGELRRALRLDAAELPPRLDAATLAARARERSSLAAASFASAMVAVAAAAALMIGATIALAAIGPELLADAYGFGLGLLAAAAVPLAGIFDTFEQPSIPIAALAAVMFAIAYEYGQRRERANVVHTS